MARLPYPFEGAPRFVVDSEGVITDQRAEMIRGVTALFEDNLTNWLIWSSRNSLPKWERPASEAADAFEYAMKPCRTSVAIDELSKFDQEDLDQLIADKLKAERRERERLIFEEQRYNGNPDCLLEISGCTCKRAGPPKGQS